FCQGNRSRSVRDQSCGMRLWKIGTITSFACPFRLVERQVAHFRGSGDDQSKLEPCRTSHWFMVAFGRLWSTRGDRNAWHWAGVSACFDASLTMVVDNSPNPPPRA